MAKRRKKKHQPRRQGLQRKVNVRELRQRFLIVCEGEKTEPYYFEDLRIRSRIPGDVKGIGEDPIRLVKHALRLKEEGDYDQVWCVFDRDAFPAHNFNAAIVLAAQNGIQVAYSNEAFELWYVLHFDFHQTATRRGRYAKILTKRLGIPYEKNLPDMYERLESLQETAIQNAERLLATYQPPRPAHNNPSTTVHLLVQQLKRFAV